LTFTPKLRNHVRMALTQNDLAQIKTIVKEAVDDSITTALKPLRDDIKVLQDEVEALRNDVKDIYDMIAELRRGVITDETFTKLALKEKLLKINAELLAAAKQAGITLPR
jgi:hypothetical protein